MVIRKCESCDFRTHGFELPKESLRVSDRCNGGDRLAGERRNRMPHPAASSGNDLRRSEADDSRWNSRCCFSDRIFGRFHLYIRRGFPRDHNEVRAPDRAQGLAIRTGGNEMLSSGPVIGADENDVGVAGGAAVLKRIIEDDDICACSSRVAYACISIGIHNHWHRGIQTRMHERLVPAVSAKNNCGRFSKSSQTRSDPRRDGSLPCSADSDVSDAHNRNGCALRPEKTGVIEPSANLDSAAIDKLERSKKNASGMICCRIAEPDSLDQAHASCRVSSISFSSRGASSAASRGVDALTCVTGPYAIVIRANGLGITNPSQLDSCQ